MVVLHKAFYFLILTPIQNKVEVMHGCCKLKPFFLIHTWLLQKLTEPSMASCSSRRRGLEQSTFCLRRRSFISMAVARPTVGGTPRLPALDDGAGPWRLRKNRLSSKRTRPSRKDKARRVRAR